MAAALLSGLVLALTSSPAGTPATAVVDPDLRRLVETELRFELDDARAMNGRSARLWLQAVDLNEDGRPDAIVLMDHPISCGSRGCSVHILVAAGAGLRRAGELLANEVTPGPTLTAGWRDLSVNGRHWTMQNGQYRPA